MCLGEIETYCSLSKRRGSPAGCGPVRAAVQPRACDTEWVFTYILAAVSATTASICPVVIPGAGLDRDPSKAGAPSYARAYWHLTPRIKEPGAIIYMVAVREPRPARCIAVDTLPKDDAMPAASSIGFHPYQSPLFCWAGYPAVLDDREQVMRRSR